MEKNITKFHAKGFFQKCVFCHLAMGDTVGASEAAETGAFKKCSKFLRCQCFGFHYIISCNYCKNSFFIVHFSLKVVSKITSFK
tara:strand:+ start:1173 stop:1424 length:252 start_codon:yes stop_codon:yes gene_type:complete